MTRMPVRALNGRDGLLLLGCLSGGWALAFTGLSLLAPRLLATTIQHAMAFGLAAQVQQLTEPKEHQQAVPLQIWAGRTAPPNSQPVSSRDGLQIQRALSNLDLNGALREAPANPVSTISGLWLEVPSAPGRADALWVYASPVAALPWLWPGIRIGSLLIGGSAGLIAFLHWQLQRPMRRMLEQLPAIPSSEPELLPESGVNALRELSQRMNRYLEQINQNQASRRRFLLGLAHDLGSPLTRLSMRLERLEDHSDLPADLQADRPLLRGDVDRLISLIHLLQEAAGSQAEPFRPRPTAVHELCERVAASYPGRRIQLELPHLQARLDQSLIERALVNLIDNALAYGAQPVRLSAAEARGQLVLQVEDSGQGLASANLLGMPRIPAADDRQQQIGRAHV